MWPRGDTIASPCWIYEDENPPLDPANGLDSAIRLQITGYEAWEDRLRLVQLADQSLDIQYFSWKDRGTDREVPGRVNERAMIASRGGSRGVGKECPAREEEHTPES